MYEKLPEYRNTVYSIFPINLKNTKSVGGHLICMHYIFAKILGRHKKSECGHNQFVQFKDSAMIAFV